MQFFVRSKHDILYRQLFITGRFPAAFQRIFRPVSSDGLWLAVIAGPNAASISNISNNCSAGVVVSPRTEIFRFVCLKRSLVCYGIFY